MKRGCDIDSIVNFSNFAHRITIMDTYVLHHSHPQRIVCDLQLRFASVLPDLYIRRTGKILAVCMNLIKIEKNVIQN